MRTPAARLALLIAPLLSATLACASEETRGDATGTGPVSAARSGGALRIQTGYREGADGVDTIAALGSGATREEALDVATRAALGEAAAIRRSDVRTTSIDVLDTAGTDSFRSVAEIDANLVLSGWRPGQRDALQEADGRWLAVAEVRISREQLHPGEVLARLAARGAPARPDIEAFIARASNRSDHDAAAQGWRTLLVVDNRAEDVIALAESERRAGRAALAVGTLDAFIERAEEPDPRWIAARDRLALQLPDPDDVVARLVRAAENDTHPDLALRVNREQARLADRITIRGDVPTDRDLLLVWLDGEVAAVLWTGAAGSVRDGRFLQDYIVDDPAAFVSGPVHVLALSGPQLAGLVRSDQHVDLVACRRGNIDALQQLQDITSRLQGWIARPEVEAQALSWTQVDS